MAKKANSLKIVKSSTGLGDTIEKITTTTGIKSVVDKLSDIFDFDCGCEERKNMLNRLFPYRKIECLTKDEFDYLDKFDFSSIELAPITQKELLLIYNRVFNQKHQASSCRVCWVNILHALKTLYIEYKK